MKELEQAPAKSKYYYGAKAISIAVDAKNLAKDPEDQLIIAEGFIRRNFDQIRKKSRFPREGFSSSWV